jgi:hypothetical protein
MSSVPNLPSARQRTRNASSAGIGHVAAQENLTRAFQSFTQAAGSLEHSYTQLQAEVARLHLELQKTNSELERTLEENARVRGYLARVVENLPCGVLVVSAEGALQMINPEARRLLEVPADWSSGSQGRVPTAFAAAIAWIPAVGFCCEQEKTTPGTHLDHARYYRAEADRERARGYAQIAGAGGDRDGAGARDSQPAR